MKDSARDSNEAQDLKGEIQTLERGIACFKVIQTTLKTSNTDELEAYKEALELKINDLHDDITSPDGELTSQLWQSLHDLAVQKLKMTGPYGIESDEYKTRWEELKHTTDNTLLHSQWNDILEDEISTLFKQLSLRERLSLKLDTGDGTNSLEWWKITPDEAELGINEIEKYITDTGVITQLTMMVKLSAQNESGINS